jgi:hypothetical protein
MVIKEAAQLFTEIELCVIKSFKNLLYGTTNNGDYDGTDKCAQRHSGQSFYIKKQ